MLRTAHDDHCWRNRPCILTRRGPRSTLLLMLLLVVAANAERTRSSGSGSLVGDARADSAEAVASPQTLLPEATRADWLVHVGDCPGVLIAPNFVLTGVNCTRGSPEAARMVGFWLTQENQSIQISVAREHQAPEFVILELSEDAPIRPVVLESDAGSRAHEANGYFNHNQRSRGVQLVGTQQAQGEDKKFAVGGLRDQHGCREEIVCVVASETCETLRSPSVHGPIFIVALQARGGDDQVVQLVGVSLASSPSNCHDATNPGTSRNQFLPLASLAEAIDLHSVGHRWAPSSRAPDKPRDSSSSDSSADGDPGSSQQQANLLDEFLQLGRLRLGNEAAGHYGAYTVLIAPRFVLTKAQWLSESGILNSNSANQSQQKLQVIFSVGTFPVKRLVFQREQQAQGDDGVDDDLVVLELEFDVWILPIHILATRLLLDIVTPTIQITVLNATSEADESNSMPTPGVISSVSLSSCPFTGTTSSSELVCAQAPHFAWNTPPATIHQGILRLGNDIIGFSTRSTATFPPSASSNLYERCHFTRLDSERHIQFISSAINQSTAAILNRDDEQEIIKESDLDVDNFPSFIATFSSSEHGAEAILCQGMLIAPKFVLTTASCALKNTISDIVFKLPHGDSVRVPYSSQKTIPHPRYNRSALSEAARFDIAILQLEVAVSVVPATLSLGGGRANQTSDELLGFRFNLLKGYALGPPVFHFSPVAFNHSEKCSSIDRASPLSTSTQATLCITPSRGTPQRLIRDPTTGDPVVGEDDAATSTGGPEHWRPPPPASTSLDGSVIGKQLNNSKYSMVGFAVSQQLNESSDLDVYSISSVSDFAVFINAYVVGSSWEADGVVVDGPLQLSKRYIVGLRVSKTGQNFCGGSLIAPSYVLTAAHCVTDGLANWVSVGSSSSSGGATEVIPIIKESIVIHHRYGSPSQFSFDAAIFEIKTPAYADPVKLDRSADFATGEKATMYGYGVLAQPRSISISATTSSRNGKTLSSEIRAVDLSLLSQAKCKATLPDIDRSMLCAVGDNGEDACKGDSGGPLVVPESRSGHDVLVGFVSSGYDCGLKNVPGIYMRVSVLAQFIEQHAVGAMWSAATVSQPPIPTVSPSTPSTNPELRDLDDMTPSNSPAPVGGVISSGVLTAPTTTSQSPNGSPIRGVNFPTDLPPQVRDALLLYLLGISSSSDLYISSDLLERLARENNEIRFFSSANLTSLLEIISRHSRKPLFARRDRFKRYKTGADILGQETSANSGVSASAICTQ